jgi:hypothetical protein
MVDDCHSDLARAYILMRDRQFQRLIDAINTRFANIPVHLQMQGQCIPVPLSVPLRANSRHSDCDIAVTTEETGLTRVVTTIRSQNVRISWLVSPGEGYCVREYKVWVLDNATPFEEISSTYRRLQNGAFIQNSSSRVQRIVDPADREMKRQKLLSKTHVRLVSVSLEPPADTVFTLEGLGLPKGVRVHDKIRDNHYKYGVGVSADE